MKPLGIMRACNSRPSETAQCPYSRTIGYIYNRWMYHIVLFVYPMKHIEAYIYIYDTHIGCIYRGLYLHYDWGLISLREINVLSLSLARASRILDAKNNSLVLLMLRLNLLPAALNTELFWTWVQNFSGIRSRNFLNLGPELFWTCIQNCPGPGKILPNYAKA